MTKHFGALIVFVNFANQHLLQFQQAIEGDIQTKDNVCLYGLWPLHSS